METELKSIVKVLKNVRASEGLTVNDEVLLEIVSRIYISQEIAKQKSISFIKPASERQKSFLKSLKVDFADDITKEDASKLIQEHKSVR